jgi:metal-dependent amidase/aminoacylase/carboxypeptidase family protein
MSTTLPCVAAEMTALRHDLHAHPEFGFELTRTAVKVAELVKRNRDEVAARQAEAERLLWIRAAGEAFPPVAEAARARFRQEARALLRAEVAAQAQRLSGASPAEAAAARQVLEALLGVPVLAGVRNPAALADLPEPERQTWQAI